MGLPGKMRIPLHHPLDRQQIRNGPQAPALPAARVLNHHLKRELDRPNPIYSMKTTNKRRKKDGVLAKIFIIIAFASLVACDKTPKDYGTYYKGDRNSWEKIPTSPGGARIKLSKISILIVDPRIEHGNFDPNRDFIAQRQWQVRNHVTPVRTNGPIEASGLLSMASGQIFDSDARIELSVRRAENEKSALIIDSKPINENALVRLTIFGQSLFLNISNQSSHTEKAPKTEQMDLWHPYEINVACSNIYQNSGNLSIQNESNGKFQPTSLLDSQINGAKQNFDNSMKESSLEWSKICLAAYLRLALCSPSEAESKRSDFQNSMIDSVRRTLKETDAVSTLRRFGYLKTIDANLFNVAIEPACTILADEINHLNSVRKFQTAETLIRLSKEAGFDKPKLETLQNEASDGIAKRMDKVRESIDALKKDRHAPGGKLPNPDPGGENRFFNKVEFVQNGFVVDEIIDMFAWFGDVKFTSFSEETGRWGKLYYFSAGEKDWLKWGYDDDDSIQQRSLFSTYFFKELKRWRAEFSKHLRIELEVEPKIPSNIDFGGIRYRFDRRHPTAKSIVAREVGEREFVEISDLKAESIGSQIELMALGDDLVTIPIELLPFDGDSSGSFGNISIKGLHSENAQSAWIFPHSSERLITREELLNIEKEKLWRARNEIYARRGLIFSTEKGKRLSESLGTEYKGTEKDQEKVSSKFNPIEKSNIKLIEELER
jgi:hypothetical protein